MTNLAHLGPPIPVVFDDTEPVRIHQIKLLGLGAQSDALVQMTVSQNSWNRAGTFAQMEAMGAAPVEPRHVEITIAINARTLAVLRVVQGTDANRMIRPAEETPGAMIDLARSFVRDTYSVRAAP
jgi:hypothetical protein